MYQVSSCCRRASNCTSISSCTMAQSCSRKNRILASRPLKPCFADARPIPALLALSKCADLDTPGSCLPTTSVTSCPSRLSPPLFALMACPLHPLAGQGVMLPSTRARIAQRRRRRSPARNRLLCRARQQDDAARGTAGAQGRVCACRREGRRACFHAALPLQADTRVSDFAPVQLPPD